MKSKVWNTFIILAMLGTGVGAWGRGMSVRNIGNGSLGTNALLDWSNVLHHDQVTRIVYIVHEAIVIAASLSVTIQVLHEYKTTNTNARASPERKHLLLFALFVVPLIWLRDIFIIYDVILLYVSTEGWSNAATLASTFLLVVFRQFANLSILAMVLWGAWRMGRSVDLFGAGGEDEQALRKSSP
ncbi:hypothetical protein N0V86_006122 [Didymella sp. IMI 355093]|nr:hypothetical protein N0V86_006122 [Didymella sp. IMI 355093]